MVIGKKAVDAYALKVLDLVYLVIASACHWRYVLNSVERHEEGELNKWIMVCYI